MRTIAHKGKSHLILNRSAWHNREDKKREQDGEKDRQLGIIKRLKEEVTSLKTELDLFQLKSKEAEKHSTVLYRLFEQNIIDEHWNQNKWQITMNFVCSIFYILWTKYFQYFFQALYWFESIRAASFSSYDLNATFSLVVALDSLTLKCPIFSQAPINYWSV